MKSAQAKIEMLLDLLVVRCEAGIGSLGTARWSTPDDLREELEWLIKMSNLNNRRQEKVGKEPGPQAAVITEMTDEDLVAQLKAGRDPDLFPRRGPRNGKRENVSTPLKDIPDVVTCAVHEGVVCVQVATQVGGGVVELSLVCPDCAAKPENVPPSFVSLKALT